MKIVILDGQTEKTNKEWKSYISQLVEGLKNKNHTVQHFVLKDKKMSPCIGCFGCWVKTPGMCVIDDESRAINHELIHADFVLWASPLVMGFPSHYLKTKIDRSIPLLHPYFEIVQGEVHHLSRYSQYPVYGLLLQKDDDDDSSQVQLTADISARTALNSKSYLAFADTIDRPAAEIIEKIENSQTLVYKQQPLHIEKALDAIKPPKRLLVVNGSPRGKKGNTPVMLQKVIDGFASLPGKEVEIVHLAQIKDRLALAGTLQNFDAVLLGFPLYTDGMPGIVKEFIDGLELLKGKEHNPAMAFLVQSGFPEAAHSRYVEKYLISVAEKLHSPYLGTLVRGGGENIRMQPETANRKLFTALNELGQQLGRDGALQPETIASLSSVEKFKPAAIPIVKLIIKVFAKTFWDVQLKRNGVYDQRFAQPYLE